MSEYDIDYDIEYPIPDIGIAASKLVGDAGWYTVDGVLYYTEEATSEPALEVVEAKLLELQEEWQAAKDAWLVKKAKHEAKLVGTAYVEDGTTYMLSATADDQFGLSSVESYVRGGMDIPYHFDNSTVLTLTQNNFDAVLAVWFPFRLSFFQ